MIYPPSGVTFFQPTSESPRIVLRNRGACVCPESRRGAVLAHCCLRPDGLHVAPVSTRPTGERTGFAHPKCYAKGLHDCSRKITLEHYFSKAVLRLLSPGGLLEVSTGNDDKLGGIPVQSYGSRVLCDRHNRALSPLDRTGAWLFGGIQSAVSRSTERDPPVRFVNGYAFERWLLKAACGSRVVEKQQVPEQWVRILFGEEEFPDGWGLHVHVRAGQRLSSASFIQTEFGCDDAGDILAWETTLNQCRFVLTLGRLVHRHEDLGATRVRHPRGLTFSYRQGPDFACWFTWTDGGGPQITYRVDGERPTTSA